LTAQLKWALEKILLKEERNNKLGWSTARR